MVYDGHMDMITIDLPDESEHGTGHTGQFIVDSDGVFVTADHCGCDVTITDRALLVQMRDALNAALA